MEALISCNDISVAYDSKEVLTDLSFEINEGDYLCIVGENGSGKSTLVKTLLSLKQPSKGKILFSPKLKRDQIGYLPQRTQIQSDFPACVWEIVLLGCINKNKAYPFYTKAQRELAQDTLETLRISELKKRSFKELSIGQQQRVLMARALCATEHLLFADEPVSGLDPLITTQLYEVLKTINDTGITVVTVSHDIKSAVRYASHILHLKNEALFFGSKDDYLKTSLAEKYIGEDKC